MDIDNLIVILGPTASGKTKLAVCLARDIGSEIISADSRQVYRGMDIGTGKDLEEYRIEGVSVPYHLIDIVDPDYEFNVFDYQRLFFHCYSDIVSRGIIPIMAGGTGLYIDAVLQGYRMSKVPENRPLREELQGLDHQTLMGRLLALHLSVHNTTDLLDRQRLIRAIEIAQYRREHGKEEPVIHSPIRPLIFGVRWDRSVLRDRITRRLRERLAAGLIDEVKSLHRQGVSWERLDCFGLEYRYVGRYLQGELAYGEMFQQLNTRIHQYAKRQETWFRRMERQGMTIHWIEEGHYPALKARLTELMAK